MTDRKRGNFNGEKYLTQAEAEALYGDMLKADYDTNNNGKVDVADDADKLGGQPPTYYADKTSLAAVDAKFSATSKGASNNANNLPADGWWLCDTGIPSNIGNFAYVQQVTYGGTASVLQVAYPYYKSMDTADAYFRYYYTAGGGWRNWKRISAGVTPYVEAIRTTEYTVTGSANWQTFQWNTTAHNSGHFSNNEYQLITNEPGVYMATFNVFPGAVTGAFMFGLSGGLNANYVAQAVSQNNTGWNAVSISYITRLNSGQGILPQFYGASGVSCNAVTTYPATIRVCKIGNIEE